MTARLDVAFGSVGKEALLRDLRHVRTEGINTAYDMATAAKRGSESYADWWSRAMRSEAADWERAKNRRDKELAAINRAQAAATEERLRQTRAAEARAESDGLRAIKREMAERKALEADLVRATEQRAKELSRAELVQSRARLARMQRETAEAIALAKRENAERASLERAMWQGREARARELAQVEKVQSDARLARMRREAAEAKAISRQEAQVTKDAARSRPAQQVGGVAAPGALFNWSVYATGINQAIMLTQRFIAVGGDLVAQAALWERYAVAIGTMEGSAFSTTRALDDLYQIAKAPGIDLEGANKYYLQLRAVGVEGERAKEIISQFANTVARSGGGGVEFERVNRQLTQMLANGRVLESELKWMKESMPELAKLMEATFGTTTAKGIRDAGISADEFVTRLTAAMAEMPRAQETLQTSIENAATAWSMFKASMVDTDIVKASLRGITSIMENIVEGRKAAKIGERMQETGASTMYISGYTKRAKESGLTDGEVLAAFQATGSEAAQAQSFMAYQRVKDAPKPKSQEEIDAAEEADKKAKDNAKRAAEQAERRRQEIQEMLAQQRVDAYNAEQATLVARRADKPGSVQRGASGMRWSDERMREDKAAEAKADKEKKDAEELRSRMEQQALERMSIRLAERDALDEMRMTEHEKALAALHEEQRLILSVTEYGTQEREKLMAEHYKRLDALERKHTVENTNVLLNGASSLFGSLAEMRAEAMGKQNDMYKKLFTLEKSFAIASASLNLSKALMDALAQGGTVWEKMAAYGTVAAMGGQLISNITAMAYSGVYDKGGDIPMGKWGIAGENGPEIIQGPAHVTSTKDTAKLLGGAGGGTSVVINNYSSAQVTEKTRPDGSIELLIQEVAAAAEDRISAGIASGSSRVATVMQSVYGVRR